MNEYEIPETWKFGTLQKDGTILIEWRISHPYRSMGTTVLKPSDDLYSQIKEVISSLPAGTRSPLRKKSPKDLLAELDDLEKDMK